MTFEEAVFAWVAEKQERDPALYSDLEIDASPPKAWSDVTFEDFSCYLKFGYDGDDSGYLYMDVADTVDFLNSVWKERA